jgi:hypothetical protein
VNKLMPELHSFYCSTRIGRIQLSFHESANQGRSKVDRVLRTRLIEDYREVGTLLKVS